MAWHGGDPRATIEALLQDRVRLQEQLAIAKACMGKGYTRGWMPGAEFEQ
ncbi:dehydrogenase [Rhizobium anhuiense]|nr:dehydrogenase [Rhizobium anhuiense]